MKEIGLFVGNYLVFLATTIFLSGVECSLWLQIFGDSPGPNLWIPVLVFWSLYRKTEEGMAMVYLLSLFLSALTALQGPLFLLCNMTLFAGLLAIRNRIYTSGTVYFMLLCGGASFSFFVISFIYSWTFESNPLSHPAWFDWILEPLLTMLAALPLVRFFYWLDRFTHKELPAKMEAIGHEQ